MCEHSEAFRRADARISALLRVLYGRVQRVEQVCCVEAREDVAPPGRIRWPIVREPDNSLVQLREEGRASEARRATKDVCGTGRIACARGLRVITFGFRFGCFAFSRGEERRERHLLSTS